MTTLSVPPSLQEAVGISESSWQSDLQTLFQRAKDRFPDVVWELCDEDDSGGQSPEEVWGHKAIIYARAPPSFQARYFQFRPPPISSPNPYSATPSIMPAQSALSLSLGVDYPAVSRSPSPFRALSPSPSTIPGGLLRLPLTMNQTLFSNELEFLYTGKGLGGAFEFLFDSADSREEGDADESRLDKLRKDLVFMWRSRLYSDVRIALTGNFSSTNHESATAIFSSHRFMLVTRSPYFYTSLLQWGKTSSAAKGANGDEPFTITLPSPPFTPASLHFALGYIYTGTLVFSHRTYDLDTAFHIMRSATYISIQSLYDEVQARIVQEMMHGLYHAFLEFPEYERITGGKWGSGGCRCRQCARRAPRVLEFAISEDVKNPHLERGARRALVGLYGEGWCTAEFAKLPEKTRTQLSKGLAKRTTPINIFSLLFATHQALKKLNNMLDSWADTVRDMVNNARKTIDEVLCRQCDKCFEQPEWVEFMVHDGARFEDAERVEWIMEAVKRGLDEKNAGLVYQTLVSSILLQPHPTEREQTMLSSTSPIRVQVEQTRMDVARWLRKRWMGVKRESGFDGLDGWALKEISHEIEVSVDELVNLDVSDVSTAKGTPSRKTVIEEPDTGSMHSLSASVLNRNAHKHRSGTPTKREHLISSSASVRSVARSTLSTTSRITSSPRPPVSSGSRPDSKLTPASSTRSSVLSADVTPTHPRSPPAKRSTPRSVTPSRSEKLTSSAASVKSHTSTLRQVSLSTNDQSKNSALRPKSSTSPPRRNSQSSITSDGSTTFKTARSETHGSSRSTTPSRSRTVSMVSTVSTVSAKTAKTSAGTSSLSTPQNPVVRVRRSSVGSRTSTLSIKAKRPVTTTSTADNKAPSPPAIKRTPSVSSARSSVSTSTASAVRKSTTRKREPSSSSVAARKSTISVISTKTKVTPSPSPSRAPQGKDKPSSDTLVSAVQNSDVQRRGSAETIRQIVLPDVQPAQPLHSPEQPRGAMLEIGIPCIIASKRARFRAFARYIGEVEGELGPWVGVEVPMNDSWTGSGAANSVDDRQWNDGTWGGIKYFDIGGASAEWDYGDDRGRRRRLDMSSSWTTGGSTLRTGGTKRDGDYLAGPDYRMKRMRSSSPSASENSGIETRGLFVRPQQVLYVVDAVGSDL